MGLERYKKAPSTTDGVECLWVPEPPIFTFPAAKVLLFYDNSNPDLLFCLKMNTILFAGG